MTLRSADDPLECYGIPDAPVRIVKIDKGLQAESDGVSIMKPMPDLDALLARATKLGT
jgi:fructose-bisphosphate aldolase class 1